MASSDRIERESVSWTKAGPVRAVGVAPEGREPFVPSDDEMAAGVEAARRVDVQSQRGGPEEAE
jgi:hypothetical protein